MSETTIDIMNAQCIEWYIKGEFGAVKFYLVMKTPRGNAQIDVLKRNPDLSLNDALIKVMKIFEVGEISQIKDRYCRIKFSNYNLVCGIGHLIEENWIE